MLARRGCSGGGGGNGGGGGGGDDSNDLSSLSSIRFSPQKPVCTVRSLRH